MKVLSRIFLIVAALELVVLVMLTIWVGILLLGVPVMQNYGENTVFVNAWGLANGYRLYRPEGLTSLPVLVAMYPPVYYALVAVGMKIWGLSYLPGRLIAVLSMIGCAVMISGVAIRRGCGVMASIIGGLVFLCAWPVYQWSGLLRVDFLAIFLELAAVFVLLGKNATLKRTILFVVFAVSAGYTKQSAFWLVIGCLSGMALTEARPGKKRVFIIAFSYAISALLVFVVMEIFTGFSFHTFVVENLPRNAEWNRLESRILMLLKDPLSVAVITLGILDAVYNAQRKWFIAFWGMPLGFALITAGNYGSGPNYFIEPLAALCVSASFTLDRIFRRQSDGRYLRAVCLLIALLCAGGGLYAKREMIKAVSRYTLQFEFKQPQTGLFFFLKQALPPGSYVLTENSDLPLLAGCLPAMSDPYLLTYLAREGKWDPSPVVRALQDHRIQLVLTGDAITAENEDKDVSFVPKEIAEAVLRYYENAHGIWGHYVYVPKK